MADELIAARKSNVTSVVGNLVLSRQGLRPRVMLLSVAVPTLLKDWKGGGSMVSVLMFTLNFAPEPTGIAPYSTQLAAGLTDRGHDVRVSTAFPHYPEWRVASGYGGMTERERIGAVPVTRFRHYVPASPTGIARAMSEASFGARLMTSSWSHPDVVLCVSPALLSTAMAAARCAWGRRQTSPALGVIVQDLYSAGLKETSGGGFAVAGLLKALERWTLNVADGVVVIHDRFKSSLVDSLGIAPDAVRVIRNWTHVEATDVDRRVLRSEFGWSDRETVVLHTGAMGEKQGLVNVVQAARLAEDQRLPVRFVLMGDGGQRSRLESLGSGLQRLEFLPPTSDESYPRMLSAADVLLVNEVPGLTEMAVPSKLTSYFVSGRPVLAATDEGSTTAQELFASQAGRRVDPGDPAALLRAAVELAGDDGAATLMGQAGRDYARQTLTAKASLDAYDEWVRSLAARRGDAT